MKENYAMVSYNNYNVLLNQRSELANKMWICFLLFIISSGGFFYSKISFEPTLFGQNYPYDPLSGT